jgi:hypothetical protein
MAGPDPTGADGAQQNGALAASPCVATGQAEIAAEGGADRRSTKIADAPINQTREAHHPARPHHSPSGASRPHGCRCRPRLREVLLSLATLGG